MPDEAIYSAQAERAVVGASMISSQALDEAMKILKPEDFYDTSTRITFQVMCEMTSKGQAIDMLTLANELTRQNYFDTLGGQPFYAELLAEVTTTANVAYHANIVKDYSMRRKLIAGADKIKSLAYKLNDDISQVIDKAQDAFMESADLRHERKSVNMQSLSESLTQAINRSQGSFTELNDSYSTGYYDLDAVIGGLQPGTLNIIAARPSVGKTALAMNIAQFGGDPFNPKPVMIFSLEMSAQELGYRMLSAECAVSLSKIKRGLMNEEEVQLATQGLAHLNELPIEIYEEPMLTVNMLRALCKRYHMAHPDLALIVIDYIQLLQTEKNYGAARVYEVSEISRTLKAIAVELKVPVLALSQLSRESDKRVERRPRLSDLRDSGSIEQDADTVMLMYREDYYALETEAGKRVDPSADSLTEIIIAKNRNGSVGNCSLLFRKRNMRFSHVSG